MCLKSNEQANRALVRKNVPYLQPMPTSFTKCTNVDEYYIDSAPFDLVHGHHGAFVVSFVRRVEQDASPYM